MFSIAYTYNIFTESFYMCAVLTILFWIFYLRFSWLHIYNCKIRMIFTDRITNYTYHVKAMTMIIIMNAIFHGLLWNGTNEPYISRPSFIPVNPTVQWISPFVKTLHLFRSVNLSIPRIETIYVGATFENVCQTAKYAFLESVICN